MRGALEHRTSNIERPTSKSEKRLTSKGGHEWLIENEEGGIKTKRRLAAHYPLLATAAVTND
jgi:hypothetical protein